MLPHVPPGQLQTSDAYIGGFLLRQRGTPVHRNASFESPPSSFPLSTLAARAHARARTGTDAGENPLTGDFSPTRKRALCCVFFFPGTVGSIMVELDMLSERGRRRENRCMLGEFALRGQRGCRSSQAQTIRAPNNNSGRRFCGWL